MIPGKLYKTKIKVLYNTLNGNRGNGIFVCFTSQIGDVFLFKEESMYHNGHSYFRKLTFLHNTTLIIAYMEPHLKCEEYYELL